MFSQLHLHPRGKGDAPERASKCRQNTPEQTAAAAAGRYEEIKLGVVRDALRLLQCAMLALRPWRRLCLRDLRSAIKYLRVEFERLKAIVGPTVGGKSSANSGDVAYPASMPLGRAAALALQMMRDAQEQLAAFRVFPTRYLAGAITTIQAFLDHEKTSADDENNPAIGIAKGHSSNEPATSSNARGAVRVVPERPDVGERRGHTQGNPLSDELGPRPGGGEAGTDELPGEAEQ